ncbi:MAG: class I mannose-6-phosphate isomerase [bacterium]|nr:class I mannose-6-phosphate isomerase [bacterium]
MTDTIYPFLLEPRLAAAIWGGDALVRRFHKPGSPEATLGEAWECWDANRVVNGPLAGKSIAQLRAELGSRLMGTLDPAEIFPLLTKIIDARLSLSVQVHPDDAYAQRVERRQNGKTECWYILEAHGDAALYLGWTRDTDRAEYERRVADGSLGELLRRVPVEAGETFYLPAGTLHAIGGGIVLFETQQASDLTYRIFDWNRAGADGRPRELHVRKAGDVLDYRAARFAQMVPLAYELDDAQRTALTSDPRFWVERIEVDRAGGEIALEGMPMTATALGEPLRIGYDGGGVALEPFQSVLVPAALGRIRVAAVASAEAGLLAAAPPADDDALHRRFASAGVSAERSGAFLAQFATARGPQRAAVKPFAP